MKQFFYFIYGMSKKEKSYSNNNFSLKVFLSFLFVTIFSYSAQYSCNGENVANINGATANASTSYSNDFVVGNGKSQYFKFKTLVDGELRLRLDKHIKQELDIGTSCGGGQVYNGASNTSDEDVTIAIKANTTYFVRIKERNGANQVHFDMNLDFMAKNSYYSCDGTEVVNLMNAINSVSDSDSVSNIKTVGGGSRYYKFKTAITGEVIVSYAFNKNTNGYKKHRMRIGTSCNGTQIYGGGDNKTSDSKTFIAEANTWYFVRVYERDSANALNFDANFNFNLIGCNASFDTSANNSSPVIITPMNGITTDTSTCFSGASTDGDKEYYKFTVNKKGTFSFNTSSPNSHNFQMRVGSNKGGTQYYSANNKQNHIKSNISLNANDTVFIYIKEYGSNTDYYEVNLNFVAYVNQSPTDITLSSNNMDENKPIDTEVGTLNSIDMDSSTFVYSLISNPNSYFKIDGNKLKLNKVLDYETATSYPITIQTEDDTGLTYEKDFTITLNDLLPPTITPSQTFDVLPNGAFISNIVNTTDGTPTSFSIESSPFSIDNASGTLSTTGTLGAVGTVYTLNVTATNPEGTSTKDITITVLEDIKNCPGVLIGNLDGATDNAEESFNNQTIDGNTYDYYHFTPQIDGQLSVIYNHQNDYKTPISIYRGGCSDTTPENDETYLQYNDRTTKFLEVKANEHIIIKLHRDGGTQNQYDIDFIFKKVCPGDIISNLDGATSTVRESFNNIEVQPGESIYYHFTPAVDGTFKTFAQGSASWFNTYIYDECGNLIDSNTSDGAKSTSTNVTAGHKIIARLWRRDSASNSITFSDIDFTFDVGCPGEIMPNLDGTGVSATDSFPSRNLSNYESDFYHFTPTVDGKFSAYYKFDSGRTTILRFYNACGTPILDSGSTVRNDYTSPEIDVVAGQMIIAEIKRDYDTSMSYESTFNFSVFGRPILNLSDMTLDLGSPFTIDLSQSPTHINPENGGEARTFTSTGTMPFGMILGTNGLLSGTPTQEGSYILTIKAEDKYGFDEQTITITVQAPPVVANDDTYDIIKNTETLINVLGNDTGFNRKIHSINCIPVPTIKTGFEVTTNNGKLKFNNLNELIYVPNTDYIGTDEFNYQIIDSFGTISDSTNCGALVNLTVSHETDTEEGLQDFVLINPENTRNIIGDYAIAGNTIECITNDRGTGSTWGTPNCQTSDAYNDNNYMARYLDVDNDPKTFNSSSSNINFPDRYLNVLWAGLFWQGSLHHEETNNYLQRRAYINNGVIDYINITSDKNLNVEEHNGNKVLLGIDGGSYIPIQADNFYFTQYLGNQGGYYASFANVTAYLKDAGLGAGKHKFTIANLRTVEGRLSSPGNYGGWSLVVIYQENPFDLNSAARNISIYNGYTKIPSRKTVKIEGFKLPQAGPVRSQFSSFAGEGEEVYKIDQMFISKNADLSNPSNMPGAIDPDNIFDALVADIDRDSGKDNDVRNTNGIDIDRYDVSNIMTDYRDEDDTISTVYIGLYSSGDYITPSMMAFSAELYKPKICLDYTVSNNGFDITDDNRTIDIGSTDNLAISVAVRNLEGDFDLVNSSVAVHLNPHDSGATSDYAQYSPNNTNTMVPAIHLTTSTPTYPEIAVGEDASDTGGTIKANQLYFTKFNYVVPGSFDGTFEVDFKTTIDFGSGAVPVLNSTTLGNIPRCPQSGVYNPLSGAFNIEQHDSHNLTGDEKFVLPTQIVGKPFDFDLVHYEDLDGDKKYTDETVPAYNYTVDIELINSAPYDDNLSIFKCTNTDNSIIQSIDSSGTKHILKSFNGASRIGVTDIITDTALRNSAFRVWYITDGNNGIIPHQCYTESCFKSLYDNNISQYDTNNYCQNCSGYSNSITGKSGCYGCLRDYFAKPICSRDNFSVRPASYRMAILDNNEQNSDSATKRSLGVNTQNSSVATLSAGYDYLLEANATSYISSEIAKGYSQDFNINSSNLKTSLIFDTSNNPNSCSDKDDNNWTINFEGGESSKPNLVKGKNTGEYYYELIDKIWTEVDQASFVNKTFKGINDCIIDSSIISQDNTGKNGCYISSELILNDAKYYNLALTFKPYSFDLTNLAYVKRPDDSDNHIFLNDFENSFYDDLVTQPVDMSVSFEGNITAKGKDGTALTNYTDSCNAEDVVLNLTRTTTPDELSLFDEDGDLIEMQQYLQIGSRFTSFVDRQTGVDKNITLPARGFVDGGGGNSPTFLNTTFQKPVSGLPINPFQINYESIRAWGSTLTQSSADMVDNFTPEGNVTYADRNITYLFARVTPLKNKYNHITESSVKTKMYVDVYCDPLAVDVNCSSYGITEKSKSQIELTNWYYATMFNNAVDGTVDLVVTTKSGADASPQVNPNSDVAFTSDIASRDDIEVSVVNDRSKKPTTVEVEIQPVPWLVYDEDNINGFPSYEIEFVDIFLWSGFGTTGEVVGKRATTETSTRMNW